MWQIVHISFGFLSVHLRGSSLRTFFQCSLRTGVCHTVLVSAREIVALRSSVCTVDALPRVSRGRPPLGVVIRGKRGGAALLVVGSCGDSLSESGPTS